METLGVNLFLLFVRLPVNRGVPLPRNNTFLGVVSTKHSPSYTVQLIKQEQEWIREDDYFRRDIRLRLR